MPAEEIRSEHVMIRLKPSEKARLDAKAEERGMKPTQLAYEAVLEALGGKYAPEEIALMLDEHALELAELDRRLVRLNRRLEKLEPDIDQGD